MNRLLTHGRFSFMLTALAAILVCPLTALAEPIHTGAAMPGGNAAWELGAGSSVANSVVVEDAIFIATDTQIERHTQGSDAVVASAPLREENGAVVSLALDDYTLYVVYESGAIDAFSIDLELLWSVGQLSNTNADSSLLPSQSNSLHVVDTYAAYGYVSVLLQAEKDSEFYVVAYRSVDGSLACCQTICAAGDSVADPRIVHTRTALVVLDSAGDLYALDYNHEKVVKIELAHNLPAQSMIAKDGKDDAGVFATLSSGTVCSIDFADDLSATVVEYAVDPDMMMHDSIVTARALASVNDACLVLATFSADDASLYLCTRDSAEAVKLPAATWVDSVLITTDLPSYNLLLASREGIYMIDVKVDGGNLALSEPAQISDASVASMAVGALGEMIVVDDAGAVTMIMAKGAATPSQNSDMLSRLMGPGAFVLVGMFVVYFILVSRAKRAEMQDDAEKDTNTRR